MQKKILILGGTDGIERDVVDIISQEKIDAEIKILFSPQNAHHFVSENPKIETLEVDFLDASQLTPFIQGATHIYCCLINSTRSDTTANYMRSVQMIRNIVNLCLNYSIQKFLYLSSAIIFRNNTFDSTHRISEDEQELPPTASPYLKSIYLAELQVKRAMHEGLSVVIVNPTHMLYPPTKRGKQSPLIDVMIRQRSYPAGTYGFVNRMNVAKAMVLLMEADHICNQSFILNATNKSYKEVLEYIFLQQNKSPHLKKMKTSFSYYRIFSTLPKNSLLFEIADVLNEIRYYNGTKLTRLLKKFNYTSWEENGVF